MTVTTTSHSTALRERGPAGSRVPVGSDDHGGHSGHSLSEPGSSPAPLSERGCTPPARSLAQRREALKKANEIRSHRAVVKRELKAGRQSPVSALEDPKCDTMLVFDLLLATPKVGRVKANKLVQQIGISRSKTIGGLSDRQAGELARYFTGQEIQVRRPHRAVTTLPREKSLRLPERRDRGTAALLDDIRSVTR